MLQLCGRVFHQQIHLLQTDSVQDSASTWLSAQLSWDPDPLPCTHIRISTQHVLSGQWKLEDRHSKSLEIVNRILTIMSHQTDPVPGPLLDRDLAAPYPLEQLGTGHCHVWIP